MPPPEPLLHTELPLEVPIGMHEENPIKAHEADAMAALLSDAELDDIPITATTTPSSLLRKHT